MNEQRLIESIMKDWKELLLESHVSDYMKKNNLTKAQAMKGDHFKNIKKIIKQGDEKAKKAIENASTLLKQEGWKPSTKASGKTSAPKGKKVPPSPKEKAEMKKAAEEVEVPMSSVSKAKKDSESNPIQGYSIGRKMYWVHVVAKKRAEEEVNKLMKEAKVGQINVLFTNSAVDEKAQMVDITAEKCTLGIHVLLENADLSTLQKIFAVIKESKMMNEASILHGIKSLFVKVGQGIASGAKDIAAEAQEKIDDATKELKRLIGVVAIKRYVYAFMTNKVADKVDDTKVFSAINEDGENKGRISYYATIEMK